MGIIVKSNSPLSTIQDLGRLGYGESGIPVSGAMDLFSARLANILVGNRQDAPVIEMLMMGCDLEFTCSCAFALTGADFSPTLNKSPIDMQRTYYAKSGDILSFGNQKYGNYCYFSISGELDIPLTLGSCSTYLKANLGGYKGRKLEKGDDISFKTRVVALSNMALRSFPAHFPKNNINLKVILGPQDDYFSAENIAIFLSENYTITNEFDRMGCRLKGAEVISKNGSDIISDGIALGSVQIPNHGQPIIMLADRQTAGGYAKIATVIKSDLKHLVQASVGSVLSFSQTSVEDARNLYIKENNILNDFEKNLQEPSKPRVFLVEVNNKTLEVVLNQ